MTSQPTQETTQPTSQTSTQNFTQKFKAMIPADLKEKIFEPIDYKQIHKNKYKQVMDELKSDIVPTVFYFEDDYFESYKIDKMSDYLKQNAKKLPEKPKWREPEKLGPICPILWRLPRYQDYQICWDVEVKTKPVPKPASVIGIENPNFNQLNDLTDEEFLNILEINGLLDDPELADPASDSNFNPDIRDQQHENEIDKFLSPKLKTLDLNNLNNLIQPPSQFQDTQMPKSPARKKSRIEKSSSNSNSNSYDSGLSECQVRNGVKKVAVKRPKSPYFKVPQLWSKKNKVGLSKKMKLNQNLVKIKN